MKFNFILLSIVVCFFLVNKSYADQKQLVGADADYGEHEDQSIYYENFSL